MKRHSINLRERKNCKCILFNCLSSHGALFVVVAPVCCKVTIACADLAISNIFHCSDEQTAFFRSIEEVFRIDAGWQWQRGFRCLENNDDSLLGENERRKQRS